MSASNLSKVSPANSSIGPGTQVRVLMCPPTAYSLEYEINPWMSLANRPDVALASAQWRALYETLSAKVGVSVELIDQAPGCPDMVFTANAGIVQGRHALLARFRHPQRQVEEPHFRRWFEQAGYCVDAPESGCSFEGEGDALFVGDTLVAGYLKRSDICSHQWMSERFKAQVLSVQLADDRWYHLDTCLIPLDDHTIVYYPGAFDAYARQVLTDRFDTIAVTEQEALGFACNAVVLGRTVVLPSGCTILERELQRRGLRTFSIDMSEFLKAGGACKCLTLMLEPGPTALAAPRKGKARLIQSAGT